MPHILNIAEKPSVAKAITVILTGSTNPTSRPGRSPYNRIYEFDYHNIGNNSTNNNGNSNPYGTSRMHMTSVAGHLYEMEFESPYDKWHTCTPDKLFTAPITVKVPDDKVDLEKQLQDEARGAVAVFLWLDCDREGEAIAFEVIKAIQQIKPRIPIKRARFSAVNDREIFRALRNLAEPDPRQSDAVLARQEIDLRIGAAFTRMQTIVLTKHFEELLSKTISYGPCQFPTVGFIVDRYTAIEKFTQERFWSIHMSSTTTDSTVNNHSNTTLDNNDNLSTDTENEDLDSLDEASDSNVGTRSATTNARLTNVARFVANPSVRYSDAGRGTGRRRNPSNNPQAQSTIDWLWQRGRLFDHLAAFVLYEKVVEASRAVVTQIRGTQETRKRPVPMNTITLQTNASRYLKIASDTTMKLAEELYIAGYISYPRTETEKFVEGTDLSLLLKNHLPHPEWGTYTRTLVNENGDRSPRFRWPTPGSKDDQAHPPIHPLKIATRTEFTNPQAWRIYELVTRHFLACCSPDATGSRTTVTAEMGNEFFTTSGLIVNDRGWLDIYPWVKWGQGNGTLPSWTMGDTFIPSSVLLHEGSTEPPNFLSEAELLKAMDTEGIGTDATMAEHIAKIQERQYVVKDTQARFSPTTLGMALITAYNSLNIPLSKPWLRARMEAACTAIAEGRRNREDVVRECLNDLKPAYDTTVANIDRLITAMRQHFKPIGTRMQTLTAQGTPLPPTNHRTTIDTAFTKCGTCGGMTELRAGPLTMDRGGRTNTTVQYVVYCVTCQQGLPMPRDILKVLPHDHVCPLCHYQVVRIVRQDRNSTNERTTELCPKCFTQPPPLYNTAVNNDIHHARIIDMPCYKCSAPHCALAKGLPNNHGATNTDGTNDSTSVSPCGLNGTCRGSMRLKRTQAGKFFLSCDQYRSDGSSNGRASVAVGGCNHAIWLPALCTSAIGSDQFCEYCSSETTGLKVRLIYFAFPSNTFSLPFEMRQPIYTHNEVVYTYLGCVYCNDSLESFGLRHNPVVTRDQRKQVAMQVKLANGSNQRGGVGNNGSTVDTTGNTRNFSHSGTVVPSRSGTVPSSSSSTTRNDLIDLEELQALVGNDPTLFLPADSGSAYRNTTTIVPSTTNNSVNNLPSTTDSAANNSTLTDGFTPSGFLAPLASKSKLTNKSVPPSRSIPHYTDNALFANPLLSATTTTNTTVNSSSNTTITSSRDGVDYGTNGYPVCPVHHVECVLRTTQNGPNQGRNFYVCPQRPRNNGTHSSSSSSSSSTGTEASASSSSSTPIDCNTFWWADQPILSKTKPSAGTSSSRSTTTTTGACFKCGSTDHWANNCPQPNTGYNNNRNFTHTNHPSNHGGGSYGNPSTYPNPGTGGNKRRGSHNDNDTHGTDDKKKRKCGKCRQEGHTVKTCPF